MRDALTPLRPGWGLDGYGDRLPRATLRGYAASLAPGWIVRAPSGRFAYAPLLFGGLST